jgi:hypothetical protein
MSFFKWIANLFQGKPELPPRQPRPVNPDPLSTVHPFVYGFTIDSVEDIDRVVAVARTLPVKPWIRVVFDVFERDDDGEPVREIQPHYYLSALEELSRHARILGELCDSFEIKDLSVDAYVSRTKTYHNVLGSLIHVWEIGNEINGVGWLGPKTHEKAARAQELIQSRGGKTALTLYMDEEESFREWSPKYPEHLRKSVDYVLMSHYSADNGDYKPNWNEVAQAMGDLFPRAWLGLGEMGPSQEHEFSKMNQRQRLEMAQAFWRLHVDHPRWIGFGGYWYGSQEIRKSPGNFIESLREVMS